jgi:hypothetical protein
MYLQGIGNDYYPDTSADRFIFLDYYIPHLYYQLVKSTHRDWNWQYLYNNKFNEIEINNSKFNEIEINNNKFNEIENNNEVEEININFNKDKNRINIGFLSSFFFRHSVGRLLASIILELVKDEAFNLFLLTDSGFYQLYSYRYFNFELFFYYYLIRLGGSMLSGRKEDDISLLLKQSIDKNNQILLPSDPVHAIELGRVCQLDILVFGRFYHISLSCYHCYLSLYLSL